MTDARERWWTEQGWASHGSKLQTQLYVARRSKDLTAKVLEALPTLQDRTPAIKWVAPNQKKGFYEPRDQKMLTELGLEKQAKALKGFWPARGPVWDALATCTFADGGTGVILAEGKSYPRELYSGGTQAGKAGTDASLESRRQIERSVGWVQQQLGLPQDVKRWLDPLESGSSLYQTANRIAYVVWLRSRDVEAWLCHLLFVNDVLHHPTTRSEWEHAIELADSELGIDELDLEYAGHALLDALDPEEVLADLHGQPPAV